MSGAALDEMIAAARRNYGLDAPSIAKLAAPAVDAAIKKTAGAATAPDGTPWPEREAGGRALARVTEHISTKALGYTIKTTLKGPDVFHHLGGRVPRRQVLPDSGELTPPIVAAIEKACADAFARALGGQ